MSVELNEIEDWVELYDDDDDGVAKSLILWKLIFCLFGVDWIGKFEDIGIKYACVELFWTNKLELLFCRDKTNICL